LLGNFSTPWPENRLKFTQAIDWVWRVNLYLKYAHLFAVATRHGPRVVDVLEGFAEAMHPQRFVGISSIAVLVKERL
jgi:hypothetical protein